MEYNVAWESSIIKFRNEVNRMIKDGWKPQGGISVSGKWYYQAMIKELSNATQ